ncbi:MAG: hypothetical protein ABJP45_02075, partial [Cyclobacteriaceae bacterium]
GYLFYCLYLHQTSIDMKKSILILAGLITIVSSCDEDTVDPSSLLGTWKLSEVLADPGDGSGTFQPTDDNYTMTFLSEGRLWMDQGLFCTPSLKLFHQGNGSYDTSRNVITSEECATVDTTPEYSYELNSSDELIVYLPCIEPCANKFIKITDE